MDKPMNDGSVSGTSELTNVGSIAPNQWQTGTGAVEPPCICPECHKNSNRVILRPVPLPPPTEQPFRYPGQMPHATYAVLHRKKMVCPKCKAEFLD